MLILYNCYFILSPATVSVPGQGPETAPPSTCQLIFSICYVEGSRQSYFSVLQIQNCRKYLDKSSLYQLNSFPSCPFLCVHQSYQTRRCDGHFSRTCFLHTQLSQLTCNIGKVMAAFLSWLRWRHERTFTYVKGKEENISIYSALVVKKIRKLWACLCHWDPRAVYPLQCKVWGKVQKDCLEMLMNVMAWKFSHKN